MLKTRNVFIDTQAFIADNFFNGRNIRRVAEFGNKEVIRIFLTEVTINEIKSNAFKRIGDARSLIFDFKKKLASNRILNHVEEFQNTLEKIKLDINFCEETIQMELKSFIKNGKVNIIPYENAKLTEIMNKYFNQEKPFDSGDKKNEFPDAIVLSALEEWCSLKGEKMYVISGDSDLGEYNSDCLIPIPKLKDLLGKITNQLSKDSEILHEIFNHSTETIKDSIEAKFVSQIKEDSSNNVENVTVNSITLYNASIVQNVEINGETIFQLDVDIDFTAELIFEGTKFSGGNIYQDRWQELLSTGSMVTVEIGVHTNLDEAGNIDMGNYSIYCTYCSFPAAIDFYEPL